MSESSTSSTWLTQEAFDRLTAELARRKEADRKEIAARVEAARQEGDLRENAGYHAAREEAGLNEARIAQLTELLEHAQIGEAADDGSVSAGTIVTARVAGKEQAFALGGQEITADVPEGVKVFSPDAPLGRALMGHKAGETFDLDLEFPKDYHVENLAGAKVVFSVTLHKVNELRLPELNDEFAAKCGPFTDVKELKADIKREITVQKEREAKEKLKDELVAELADSSKVALPELLIDDQLRSIEQDLMQNLSYRGLTLDSYLKAQGFKDKADWQKKEARPAAEKRVKAGLVLAELSKELGVEVSREELDMQISTFKQQYGKDAKLAARFDDPNVHRDIANRMITDKTIDKLVELNSK